MIEEAFGDRVPETAQYDIDVDDVRAVLAALKPAFNEHQGRSRTCSRSRWSAAVTRTDVLRRPANAHVDVDNYLTTGSLAFTPARRNGRPRPIQ